MCVIVMSAVESFIVGGFCGTEVAVHCFLDDSLHAARMMLNKAPLESSAQGGDFGT